MPRPAGTCDLDHHYTTRAHKNGHLEYTSYTRESSHSSHTRDTILYDVILFCFTHFRYETMLLCWLESPAERPTFVNLVKCLHEMIKRLQNQTPYYNLQDGTVPSLANGTSDQLSDCQLVDGHE